jgi:hypothetical protein
MTLEEARREYFKSSGFAEDGGYSARFALYKIGPFRFQMPNVQGRRRAVKIHDLHHIPTGYETKFSGELEIGAWEIGTGCRDYYVAWVLNFSAFRGRFGDGASRGVSSLRAKPAQRHAL